MDYKLGYIVVTTENYKDGEYTRPSNFEIVAAEYYQYEEELHGSHTFWADHTKYIDPKTGEHIETSAGNIFETRDAARVEVRKRLNNERSYLRTQIRKFQSLESIMIDRMEAIDG